MTKAEWVSKETKSPIHLVALIGIFCVYFVLTACGSEGWPSPVAVVIFFLVTSWPLLSHMIIMTLALSAITMAFPPLAPLILIVVIVFFCLRIRFVFKNWRPIIGGLLMYGSFLEIYATDEFAYDVMGVLSSLGFYNIWDYKICIPFGIGILGAICLHFLLRHLYSYGYSAKSALGIMGSVPLIALAFALPFLKLHMGDAFPGGDIIHTHTGGDFMDTGHGVVGEGIHHGTVDPVFHAHMSDGNHDVADTGADGGLNGINPELHHVAPHIRETAAGPVYVRGHMQTNPDAIVDNNLGYHHFHITDETAAPVPAVHDLPKPAEPGSAGPEITIEPAEGKDLEKIFPKEKEEKQLQSDE